ncbi:hypothetical protein SSX86_007289 [Deinandra increscens subsp. villosa]|uniref:Replication protein A 70 kDa DNA-binding subunit B/D first OB fold domain-containing protein n=1 Tax=Deinandra increscens subsp. villosa TaxID=3103831 RepID=A0AAP0DHS8_9ASTR
MNQAEVQLFQPLNELQVSNVEHYVKVRVLSVWRRPLYSNPTQSYSVEFVCADEQGNKISGSCLGKWLYRFQRFFINQNVLLIKRPLLGANNGDWRIVDNQLKLCFNVDTHVGQSSEWNADAHFFNFTDFKQIVDLQAPTTVSIDIIGALIDNTGLIPFKTKAGKDCVKVTVKLQDIMGELIYVTLFDDFAHQLLNYLDAHKDELHYVIILQFGRFKVFEGRHSVSNAYNGSNLFINSSDVNEVASFLERFLETLDSPNTPSYSRMTSGNVYNIEDDFLNVTVFNHTAEVESIYEANKVIILGTIKMVNKTWYYKACNHCKRIVEVIDESLPITEVKPLAITDGQPIPIAQEEALSIIESEAQPITQSQPVENNQVQIVPPSGFQVGIPSEHVAYKCSTQDCIEKNKVIKPYPRFKILIKVQDSSGTVDLTLFDSEAKKILHKTAQEVLDKFEAEKKAKSDGDGLNIPSELQALLERRYAFKIDVSDFNIKKRYKYYTIVKVTDNGNIIKALDHRHNTEQHYLTDSLASSSKEPQSNQSAYQKDIISVTDDNETPLSVNMFSKRGEVMHVSDLKRNLDQVYDEDIPPASSSKTTPNSVKSVATSSSNNETGVNDKLIIPKVEK